MTNYVLEKANNNNYTLWIGLAVVIIICILFTTRNRRKSRLGSRLGSRSASRSVSLSSRIGSWFSRRSTLSDNSQSLGRRNRKQRKLRRRGSKIGLSSNRINSPNNIRLNSPNTSYYVNYNAPRLYNCKKNKYLNRKLNSSDIDINSLIRHITKTNKNTSGSTRSSVSPPNNNTVSVRKTTTGATKSSMSPTKKNYSIENYSRMGDRDHYDASHKGVGDSAIESYHHNKTNNREYYSDQPVGVGNLKYEENFGLNKYYENLSGAN
jgi:hypothetical protein